MFTIKTSTLASCGVNNKIKLEININSLVYLYRRYFKSRLFCHQQTAWPLTTCNIIRLSKNVVWIEYEIICLKR